jgi:inhibitor of cysteine peptidase
MPDMQSGKIIHLKRAALMGTMVALMVSSIVACAQASPPAPAPGRGVDVAPRAGRAQVQSIDILILESFPVQVHVVAKGNHPDSCTATDQLLQEREGNTFRLTLTTTRPEDKMCPQEPVPFEQVIPLDVYGLAAGTYTVDVNGVTGTFTLDIDNVPQG